MKTTNKPNNNALGNIATTYVDRQELESEATIGLSGRMGAK